MSSSAAAGRGIAQSRHTILPSGAAVAIAFSSLLIVPSRDPVNRCRRTAVILVTVLLALVLPAILSLLGHRIMLAGSAVYRSLSLQLGGAGGTFVCAILSRLVFAQRAIGADRRSGKAALHGSVHESTGFHRDGIVPRLRHPVGDGTSGSSRGAGGGSPPARESPGPARRLGCTTPSERSVSGRSPGGSSAIAHDRHTIVSPKSAASLRDAADALDRWRGRWAVWRSSRILPSESAGLAALESSSAS